MAIKSKALTQAYYDALDAEDAAGAEEITEQGSAKADK